MNEGAFPRPAIRAALRAGNTTRAVEWLRWALRGYPMIETEIAADRELAPLLEQRGDP